MPLRMAGFETAGSVPAIQMFIQSLGCCWPSCLRLSTDGPPWRPCRSGKVGGTPPRSGPWHALQPALLMIESAAAAPPPPAPAEADGAVPIAGFVPDRLDATYTPPTSSTKTDSPSAQRGSPERVGIGACGVIGSVGCGSRRIGGRQRQLDRASFGVEQEDVDQEREPPEVDQTEPGRGHQLEGQDPQVGLICRRSLRQQRSLDEPAGDHSQPGESRAGKSCPQLCLDQESLAPRPAQD